MTLRLRHFSQGPHFGFVNVWLRSVALGLVISIVEIVLYLSAYECQSVCLSGKPACESQMVPAAVVASCCTPSVAVPRFGEPLALPLTSTHHF